MRLVTPLGLAAAALVVPLITWYLLRARRPRVDISSTLLWRRSGESVTAAVPWQRFRGDRTFWLVLAALLLGALALARPALEIDTPLGAHTIMVVDASASMSTDEDGPSRLELARRRASEMLAGLGPRQTVSVIRAADRARVLVSGTGDATAARAAIAAVTPSQGPADLDDALTLAASLAQPGQPTVVQLLTDHAPTAAETGPTAGDVRVTAVGTDRDNVAVTRMQAVPTAGATRLFVQVRNFGVTPADVALRMTAGSQELAARTLRLAARTTDAVVVDVTPPPDAAVVRATVQIADATAADGGDTRSADALTLDDTAATVVTSDTTRTALVAGPGNVFVEQALAAAGVEVRTAARVPDDVRDVDLLVVDRVTAPDIPPVPTIALAPTRPFAALTTGAPVADPVLTFQSPDHPLLRDVDLSRLAVTEARPVTADALTTVAGGPDGALIAAGRLEGQPVVHVGFGLLTSTLPLDVAWPVLMSNTVQWLTGTPTAAPIQVGMPLPLEAPAGATALTLTRPDGSTERLDTVTSAPRADQVGVWQVAWDGVDVPIAAVAVNAVPEESDLVAERPTRAATAAAETVGRGLRVFGPGIAAAVLVLLVAEWVLAGRTLPRPRMPRLPRRRRPRGTA